MASKHMWCRTLQETYRDNSLLYMLDHRHGHWNDLGPVGRAVNYSTLTANAFWQLSADKGWGVCPGNGSRLVIPHAADQLITQGTLLVLLNRSWYYGVGAAYIDKRAAANGAFVVYQSAPTVITVKLNATLYAFTVDFPTIRSLLLTFSNKGNVELLVNGVSAGIQAGGDVPGTDVSDITLMNNYSAGAYMLGNTFAGHALWNRVLSTTEQADVLTGWSRQTAITKPKKNFVVPTPIIDRSLDPRLDLDMSIVGGKVIDRSAYGNHGTLLGGSVPAIGVFDKAIRTNISGPSGAVAIAASLSLNVLDTLTSMIWVKPDVIGNSAIIHKYGGVAPFSGIGHYISGGVQAFWVSGESTWKYGLVNIVARRYQHLAATANATKNKLRLFFDGIEERVHTFTATASHAATAMTLNGTSGAPFVGETDAPAMLGVDVSPEKIYKEYLKGAIKPLYQDDFSDYPVSPAAIGVSGKIGSYTVALNSAKVTIDANLKKWITGQVAYTYANRGRERALYGTFEFKFIRDPASDYTIWVTDDTAQNGYVFVFIGLGGTTIWRLTGGAVVASFCTSAVNTAANTEYTCRFVRRSNGVWVAYIKGGVYADFTILAGPATDNIHAVASVVSHHLGPNSSVGYDAEFLGNVRPASAPWELATGTYSGEMVDGIPCKVQVTAGYSFIPKDLDFKRAEFYGVHADASVTDWFMGMELGSITATDQQGYLFRAASNEKFQLWRLDSAVSQTLLAETAINFIVAGTLYQYRIERTALGVWTVKVKGGAYADWTVAIGPVTDITYTALNYWIEDHDAGDKSSAPQFFKDLA